jgi:hypothetical protein
MEELRREREGAEGVENQNASEQIPVRANRIGRVAIAVSRSRSLAGWGRETARPRRPPDRPHH